MGEVHSDSCHCQACLNARRAAAQTIRAIHEGRKAECAGGCGLAPEPGDIFCQGCREGFDVMKMYGPPRDL